MFSLFNQIDPIIFLVSLLIGLLYSYWSTPTVTSIIKYPTPFNIHNTVYKDINGVCYKYKIREVNCPADHSKIAKFDITNQENK